LGRTTFEEGWHINEEVLAGAILEQAVEDWRSICKHRHIPSDKDFKKKVREDRKNIISIRRFFKSRWACLLAGSDKQTMQTILEQLESEYNGSLIKLQIEGIDA